MSEPSEAAEAPRSEGSQTASQPGIRLVIWGWTLLTVLGVAAVPLTKVMVGGYSGGKIHVRSWMVTYNNVMLTAHLITLVLATVGAAVVVRRLSGGARWLGWGAVALFGLTAASLVGMILFPYVVGVGPWPADSDPISWMRHGVYLPGAMRSVAWALLVGALLTVAGSEEELVPPLGYVALLALVLVDLGLVIWKWAATPKAVIALIHAHGVSPLHMIPWLAAGVLFVLILRLRCVPAE